MKKIIDGKVYNTETAEHIAGDGYSHCGDFNYWYEDLYKTKKGQYFIAGEGGPMSRYSKSVGNNNVTGSSNIFLLTEEEAREWLEHHADPDVYEAEFPVEEG